MIFYTVPAELDGVLQAGSTCVQQSVRTSVTKCTIISREHTAEHRSAHFYTYAGCQSNFVCQFSSKSSKSFDLNFQDLNRVH